MPASGFDEDMPYSGSWKYALYCGYRREASMHLIYEPGYIPMDEFIRTSGPQKYCDWPHILLQLDAGDKASYSVREAEEAVPVIVVCRADADNKIRVTEGDKVLFEGSVPVAEEMTELAVGELSAADRSTLTIECLEGSAVFKEIRF